MSQEDMDWSPTFCLACDRQTSGNAYCGEDCRLAEYGGANTGSEASSPASHQASISWPSKPSNNFYVPSAYDVTKRPSTSSSHPRPQTQPIYTRPVLTPSSSQSSLFSMQSSSSTSSEQVQLSDKARRELRGYASSFDQFRNHRRQSTS
ncbi:hypothetical protein V499_03075 [Pseudogymnoascus sp. VKM F-103]|uniref:Uncharacterized protein n=1 Tax=Pseudogymnoascus verrucosus TaxID=342668 RepID=A0A1B8GCD7_9PEZI|nr:uncharacterized protein VE01_08642 [Pseudogymnoascus verrucosus]KFY77562.1 hypothetical protein V499_03075 [Pseudogymnoascus sp. VKM F-103]OBT93491.1 hypothetical protein VE01_08642 [Pseudogymnoascus verrucosus]